MSAQTTPAPTPPAAPLAPACRACTRQDCCCDLPTDAEIDESNRRAAERRQGSSPLVVIAEPASPALWPALGEPQGID